MNWLSDLVWRFFRRKLAPVLPLNVVVVEMTGSDGSEYRFNLHWNAKQVVAGFPNESPPNVWMRPLDTLHLTWVSSSQ